MDWDFSSPAMRHAVFAMRCATTTNCFEHPCRTLIQELKCCENNTFDVLVITNTGRMEQGDPGGRIVGHHPATTQQVHCHANHCRGSRIRSTRLSNRTPNKSRRWANHTRKQYPNGSFFEIFCSYPKQLVKVRMSLVFFSSTLLLLLWQAGAVG